MVLMHDKNTFSNYIYHFATTSLPSGGPRIFIWWAGLQQVVGFWAHTYDFHVGFGSKQRSSGGDRPRVSICRSGPGCTVYLDLHIPFLVLPLCLFEGRVYRIYQILQLCDQGLSFLHLFIVFCTNGWGEISSTPHTCDFLQILAPMCIASNPFGPHEELHIAPSYLSFSK